MTQAEQILELLRDRGDAGASNFELMNISYQYPARIHTLRHKLGHEISVTHVKDKEWKVLLEKDAGASGKAIEPKYVMPGFEGMEESLEDLFNISYQPEQATLLEVPQAKINQDWR